MAALNGSANGATSNGTASTAHDNTRLQVIDDEKRFTQELNDQLDRWELREAGFAYDIVAVFGSQSTGKSTLLNRLFGTTFDVMDETKRQQTTKGIWMCRGENMNVLVMDVEGTDGRERGEDQDFERKSALFSLASSEVLLINLWEHQVGLYQGANMGLLKTVMEVNLGLFGGKKSQDNANQRTLLLFVIRDFIGQTPLENLSATLLADINKIWDSLSKPEELRDRQLSDYFDLSFTALPHKVLVPDKFEAEVKQLRKRFTDKDREDYVFKPSYHKRIPADGVAMYMETIWEQVQTNKDLDLPTQQELLAQFRCDEISNVALSQFNDQAKSQRKPVESGKVVDGLGGLMRTWKADALSRYDKEASRYHQGVYKRKRLDLLAALDSVLSPLFFGQLKNLHKANLVAFKKEMLDAMRGEGYNFGDIVATARERCEKNFVNGANEALLEETDWSYDDELELLRGEVAQVASQCRADETKKMVNMIERNFKKQIAEPIELSLNHPTPQMWDKILIAFNETLDKAEAVYLAKAKSFNSTDEENTISLTALRKRAWLALRGKIDEQTADGVFLGKLRAHFEERFRYDEEGVPRVWKPEDDIDVTFRKARDETLELIPLYSKMVPMDISLEYTPPADDTDLLSGDSMEMPTTQIYTETKALDLQAKFRREADAYYVEAKRSTVSSVAQVPYWIYGVMVVLGWNEAMAVLFNPLYFAMLAVGLASAYAIVQLGLAGPLLQVSRTVAREIQNQATARLREHFSQPPALGEPVRVKPLEDEVGDGNMMEMKRVKGEVSVKSEDY